MANQPPDALLVKLVFNDDVRRVRLVGPTATFRQLEGTVRSLFPQLGAFILRYVDEEGDSVRVATDQDLQEATKVAFQAFKGSIKLHVDSTDAPCEEADWSCVTHADLAAIMDGVGGPDDAASGSHDHNGDETAALALASLLAEEALEQARGAEDDSKLARELFEREQAELQMRKQLEEADHLVALRQQQALDDELRKEQELELERVRQEQQRLAEERKFAEERRLSAEAERQQLLRSEFVARQLQDAFDRELEHRSRSKLFHCKVCDMNRPISDLFVLSECSHELCHGCARLYLRNAVRLRRKPVGCPVEQYCRRAVSRADLLKAGIEQSDVATFFSSDRIAPWPVKNKHKHTEQLPFACDQCHRVEFLVTNTHLIRKCNGCGDHTTFKPV